MVRCSAVIPVVAGIVSVLKGLPVRNDLAMTGEILDRDRLEALVEAIQGVERDSFYVCEKSNEY